MLLVGQRCVHHAADFSRDCHNLGDDANTVAAVTGQLAGAIWGSILDNWLAKLAWCDC
jgi:ADP-ribosyl-[dinitrogen reductase] hydrolase